MSKILLILIALLFILACTPPEKNMRERYVNDNPELKSDIKKAILEGDVIVGMTKEQVYASWATPIFKGEKREKGSTYEYWTYPNVKNSPFVNIYFADDFVVKIEKTDKEPLIK
ncbi:MAG: hypothetical protein JSU85_12200 [Candidatus Zixiibacteriota bacterium]|nr:MAG: hypothetical protein JSU85_12200 [candidate division Zixibacteria bacterium]